MKKSDFLLEINVQELPVSYIRPALEQLCRAFLKVLDDFNIEYDKKENFVSAGTKDRLLFYIKDMSAKQKDSCREIIGPPKRIAFDEKGKITKQGAGFAKNQGVEPEDLRVKTTQRGEYLFIEKKTKGRDTRDVLREIIPGIIERMHFPKTMKWDDSGLRFARPVESTLVLFGKDKLEIKLGKVLSKKVESIEPKAYLRRVSKETLLDPDNRKNKIRKLILKAISSLGADRHIDEALLEEVNFLVDWPGVFVGEFDKKFLTLPEEVLRVSMTKHQRVFPVAKKGRLLNKFIAITNGRSLDIRAVKKNYEKILEARLQDSLFFFDEDTKKPFTENLRQLKDLIFQKDLGSMFEKTQRLKTLSFFVCEKLGLEGSLKKDIERAAELSKADLVTHMVGEFPSLQGVMGGAYALKAGETPETAAAIKEHYLPHGTEDMLPKSLAGSILAVSDKMDNIVGFLGMGVEVSGSFDPFGIRRNAQGLIQVIKNKSLRLKTDEFIEHSIELYGDKLKLPSSELKARVTGYIEDRIDFLAGDIRPLELKKAVLNTGCLDIVDAFNRLGELSSISGRRDFLEAAKVVERTSNILKGAKEKVPEDVDEELLREELERAVWKVYAGSKNRIEGLIEKEDYVSATREYAGAFYKVLHEFFDNVLVNVDEEAVRLNRLALMKKINKLYSDRIADLALIPQIVVK